MQMVPVVPQASLSNAQMMMVYPGGMHHGGTYQHKCNRKKGKKKKKKEESDSDSDSDYEDEYYLVQNSSGQPYSCKLLSCLSPDIRVQLTGTGCI